MVRFGNGIRHKARRTNGFKHASVSETLSVEPGTPLLLHACCSRVNLNTQASEEGALSQHLLGPSCIQVSLMDLQPSCGSRRSYVEVMAGDREAAGELLRRGLSGRRCRACYTQSSSEVVVWRLSARFEYVSTALWLSRLSALCVRMSWCPYAHGLAPVGLPSVLPQRPARVCELSMYRQVFAVAGIFCDRGSGCKAIMKLVTQVTS